MSFRSQVGLAKRVTLEEVKRVNDFTSAKVLRSEHAWLLEEQKKAEGLEQRE